MSQLVLAFFALAILHSDNLNLSSHNFKSFHHFSKSNTNFFVGNLLVLKKSIGNDHRRLSAVQKINYCEPLINFERNYKRQYVVRKF